MKFIVVFLFTLIALKINILSDLTEKNHIKVSLPKHGVYDSYTEDFYQEMLKRSDSESSLEGKGFFGKLIEKAFPQGKKSLIFKVPERQIYHVNHADSTYVVTDIEKYFNQDDDQEEYVEEVEESSSQEESTEKNYTVIRREFKVIDTGESRKVNQFEAQVYHVLFIEEIQYNESSLKKTDSFFIEILTTDENGDFAKAGTEKAEFQKSMMEAVGLESQDVNYSEMLGINWLKIVQSLNTSETATESEEGMDYAEMRKIKGYPVYVKGTFYSRKDDPTVQTSREQKKTRKKSRFGGFGGLGDLVDKAQGAIEEKIENAQSDINKGYQELLTFQNETIEISFDPLSSDIFSPPMEYHQK